MVLLPHNQRRPRVPINCEEAWNKIEKVGHTIVKNQSLRNRKDRRIITLAFDSLSQDPISSKDRKFRDFLSAIQLRCEPHSAACVTICATAIGKDGITCMKRDQRDALLDKLESECGGSLLSSPVLKQLAVPFSHHASEETRNTSQPHLPLHNSYSTIDGTTYEHASPEGIAAIFKEELCATITRVPFQIEEATVCKAAVTTTFPLWGGLVNCLISLDISMLGVDFLAMALFNARIRSAESIRHVTFNDGPMLLMPNSELTMKAVKDEAIVNVFGFEISEAIKVSPVRRREIEQGRLLTEFVSMIITAQGAIINLSLDLDCGIEISKKLYA